jgi:phage host-nuclease inhibitor protein Gam
MPNLDLYSPEVVESMVKDGWRPKTIQEIEFALECLSESETEINEINSQLAEVIARAEARATHIKGAANRRASFFRACIAQFAEQYRQDFLVGKKKSRDFLSGRVGWRKKGGRLKVEDKDALASWLTGQDASLYRVRVEPEMAALQEHARTTGEVPPGTVWDEERDEIFVESTPLMLPKDMP